MLKKVCKNKTFLNVKGIQHIKLNTISTPCVDSLDYNFQNCVYAKMISKVGCRPYWMDYFQTDLKNCTEASDLDLFIEYMEELNSISTDEELLEKYNCIKPCIYMEYKVHIEEVTLEYASNSNLLIT